ncbi:MAG: proteasome accessory factor PafA2 family protein [Terracidiphilus sp.]
MPDRLLGVETEYAISGMQGVEAADHRAILRHLMDLAHTTLRNLRDGNSSGLFMENAARLYLDSGMHVEFSTPECANPWDAVRYVEAGHRTLLSLIEKMTEERTPAVETGCYRVNVDYSGSGATWGCHESYQHQMEPAAAPQDLIPHLVTRTIYAGAGGFDPFSAGLKFTLSPRAAHIERAVSSDSTSERGIYHTKNETLCAGHNRLHVLCGESLCSHLAMFVKFGATCLVVAMAEAGLAPGNAVQLDSPAAALRAVADDPTLTKPLKVKDPSRRMTALEIQRHYLGIAEAHARDSFMPPWAPEVCKQWRGVLDLLEAGAGAQTLDWQIKLALYSSHAEHCGFNWSRLAFWNAIVERMRQEMGLAADGAPFPLELAISAETPIPGTVYRIEKLLRRNGLAWDELRRILTLRARFFEIDTRFGQIGSRGIFSMLDEDGALDHRMHGVDNIEHAVRCAPDKGRAKIRGAVVRRLAGDLKGNWYCCWDRIFSNVHCRALDLSDPFAEAESWHDAPACENERSELHF